MVCANCGAAFPESELKCPYCGSENKEEAERRYSRKLEEFDQEAEEIKKLPEKMVSKSSKKLMIIGICGAGCAVICLLAVFAIGKISANREYKLLQRQLDQLESYYQAQSYPEMREYMAEKNIYGTAYKKYWEVADAYYPYLEMCREIELFGEIVADGDGERILYSLQTGLRYGADALDVSQSGMEDKGILGNEDVLAGINEDTVKKLKEELGLKDEEIESLTANREEIIKTTEHIAISVKERWE